MSIFSEECPQCAATRPADASCCGCGYLFDPYLLDDAQHTLGLAVEEDEKLYEEYLAARAAQAAEAAKTKAAEQSAKSWRTKLAAQATKAAKGVARQQVRLAVKTIRAAPAAAGAAKAARIRKAGAAPPVSGRHLTPSKKPGATFRAAQAAKAAKALRATLARETVECQWCTATVAASAVRCRCGYPLQNPKREVPALGIDARAALAKDGHLKSPADKPSDSLIAIYTAADAPKAD